MMKYAGMSLLTCVTCAPCVLYVPACIPWHVVHEHMYICLCTWCGMLVWLHTYISQCYMFTVYFVSGAWQRYNCVPVLFLWKDRNRLSKSSAAVPLTTTLLSQPTGAGNSRDPGLPLLHLREILNLLAGMPHPQNHPSSCSITYRVTKARAPQTEQDSLQAGMFADRPGGKDAMGR